MKIVFFGTPPFSARVLDDLIRKGHEVIAVVTRPDRPKGRFLKLQPSAVKTLCVETYPNLPLFEPQQASSPAFEATLRALTPDVFVVVGYGEIMGQRLLNLPRLMPINIHASLLPKYRGAAPMQRALMNGEMETGITIMEMVRKMDAGPILGVAKVAIDDEMTLEDLQRALCRLAGPTLMRVLDELEGGTLKKHPQDHAQATLATKISLEDRTINWRQRAQEIHNQIRGLSPLPGAFTFVDIGGVTKRLGIKRSHVQPKSRGPCGTTLLISKTEWTVACGEGALSLLAVQLEGKKNLSIASFLRGQSPIPVIKVD